MDNESIEENKDIYIIETDFKDKNIKELIKELILNTHIATSPET